MKKTTLMQWPLMLCLAAVVGVSAAPPEPKSVSETREQEERKMFAAQDKKADKAKAEAAKGNYEGATTTLFEVIQELTLQLESVDSWVARERLREFTDLLRQWRDTYGRELVVKAQDAYASARYDEAIDLANKAKKNSDAISAEADTVIGAANSHISAVNRQDSTSFAERSARGVSADTADIANAGKSEGKAVSAESDIIKDSSDSRLKAKEHKLKVNPYNVDPQLAKKEEQIKALLAAARTLMKNGKYEDAREKIEKIFTINAFNAEAAQLANELYKKFYIYGYKRRQADIAGQLAYEEWQWVEPLFPREGPMNEQVDTIVKGSDDHGTQAKLDKIMFPKVSFSKTEISSVVEWLHRNNPRHDSIDRKGVVIEFEATSMPEENKENAENLNPDVPVDGEDPANEPAPRRRTAPRRNANRNNNQNAEEGNAVSQEKLVTLELSNVSLRDVLNYICYLTGLKYTVTDGKVSLAYVTSMYARSFYVSSAVTRLIRNYDEGKDEVRAAGDKLGAGEEDVPVDDVDKKSGSKTTATRVSADALKKFFEVFGVTFPEGSKIAQSGTNTIVMTNSEENMRLAADVLQELNVAKPMVQVEVKSIELTDEDLEELGFNWSMGVLDNRKKNNTQGWIAGQGNNTNYTDDGEAKVLSMLGNMLSTQGTTPHLIQNLNLFPDLFGSVKPFGTNYEFNLSLTINALDRSDRTEIVSAPKVLVNSGETATVIMGKRYYFPESWDEIEVEVEDGGDDGAPIWTVTRPVPDFGESELMGTTFTVTPTVLDDNKTIRLVINPKSVSGGQRDDETYDIVLNVYVNGQLSDELSEVFKIWRPVIQTRELNVQVDVFHGETLVLGGLSDSRSASRLDKIPILADIPFIGRLFQSHSEQSFRNNTLIFVTAKLMDNSGVPVRRMESNFGIPDVGR